MLRAKHALLAACIVALWPSSPAVAQDFPGFGQTLTPEEGRILKVRIASLSRQYGLALATINCIADAVGARSNSRSLPTIISLIEQNTAEASQWRVQAQSLKKQLLSIQDESLRIRSTVSVDRALKSFDAGDLSQAQRDFESLQSLQRGRSTEALEAWAFARDALVKIANIQLRFSEAAQIAHSTAVRAEDIADWGADKAWASYAAEFKADLTRYETEAEPDALRSAYHVASVDMKNFLNRHPNLGKEWLQKFYLAQAKSSLTRFGDFSYKDVSTDFESLIAQTRDKQCIDCFLGPAIELINNYVGQIYQSHDLNDSIRPREIVKEVNDKYLATTSDSMKSMFFGAASNLFVTIGKISKSRPDFDEALSYHDKGEKFNDDPMGVIYFEFTKGEIKRQIGESLHSPSDSKEAEQIYLRLLSDASKSGYTGIIPNTWKRIAATQATFGYLTKDCSSFRHAMDSLDKYFSIAQRDRDPIEYDGALQMRSEDPIIADRMCGPSWRNQ